MLCIRLRIVAAWPALPAWVGLSGLTGMLESLSLCIALRYIVLHWVIAASGGGSGAGGMPAVPIIHWEQLPTASSVVGFTSPITPPEVRTHTAHRPLAAGCWLLAAGCWLLLACLPAASTSCLRGYCWLSCAVERRASTHSIVE